VLPAGRFRSLSADQPTLHWLAALLAQHDRLEFGGLPAGLSQPVFDRVAMVGIAAMVQLPVAFGRWFVQRLDRVHQQAEWPDGAARGGQYRLQRAELAQRVGRDDQVESRRTARQSGTELSFLEVVVHLARAGAVEHASRQVDPGQLARIGSKQRTAQAGATAGIQCDAPAVGCGQAAQHLRTQLRRSARGCCRRSSPPG
jgi:hypothetical protein